MRYVSLLEAVFITGGVFGPVNGDIPATVFGSVGGTLDWILGQSVGPLVRSFTYADPHLAVLAVLFAFWALDKAFAAVALFRTWRSEASEESSASA